MDRENISRPSAREKRRAGQNKVSKNLLSIAEIIDILKAAGTKKFVDLSIELEDKSRIDETLSVADVERIWKILDEVITDSEDPLSGEIVALEAACAKIVLLAWRDEMELDQSRQSRSRWLSYFASQRERGGAGLTVGDGMAELADAARLFAILWAVVKVIPNF